MKKMIAMLLVLCLLLAGCGGAAPEAAPTEAPQTEAAQTEAAVTVYPLPDTTMENLTDAILSVSLAEGDAYVDDEGIMRMDLTIYSYDRYDMVDIAMLQVGDILASHAGDVEVTSLEQQENGTLRINGGLDAGGVDLVTDDSGVYYAMGYNDVKSWYEAGQATIRVSVDFEAYDRADLDLGEVVYYPGSFLVGEVTNYDFTPYNTTVRVEAGQIVELIRSYTP